jgi:hypothetical protein
VGAWQKCPANPCVRRARDVRYKRALCEDPDDIRAWFELVGNTKAKHGILDDDICNFDETGFMMGQIVLSMVVTALERRSRLKAI